MFASRRFTHTHPRPSPPESSLQSNTGRSVHDCRPAVERAFEAIASGGMVLVADDAARENEVDLVMAAQDADTASIAFMVRHSSGVICTSLSHTRLDELRLPPMVAENTESQQTAFTITVDLQEGTSSGISAADRAKTIRALDSPDFGREDFTRPGHVFPLACHELGVFGRAGHTEAARDLVRLARRGEAAVLCEVVQDDGSVLRGADAGQFAAQHAIPLVSVADLVAYRRLTEQLVRRETSVQLPTPNGDFTLHLYRSLTDGIEHVALTLGDPGSDRPALCRIHSECFTGDVLRSLRCDCGEQLQLALEMIGDVGAGVLVYLREHEGRGTRLTEKLCAYALEDRGCDTVEMNLKLGTAADDRDYTVAAQILRDLGIDEVRLMTDEPTECNAVARSGLQVAERIALETVTNDTNRRSFGSLGSVNHSQWRHIDDSRDTTILVCES